MPNDMIRIIASRMKTDVKKKLNIFNVYCSSYNNMQQQKAVTNSNSVFVINIKICVLTTT